MDAYQKISIGLGIAGLLVGAGGDRILQFVRNRHRKDKGVLEGSIDELLVPSNRSHSLETFKSELSQAREVRMCGSSLRRVIDEVRFPLRDFVRNAGELRVLLLDPDSNAVNALDKQITETKTQDRRQGGWLPIKATDITKNDLIKVIQILKEGNIINSDRQKPERVRLCDTLLPFSMWMVERKDGSGWLSLLIYPLHPDMGFDERLVFTLGDNRSELWQLLKEQFNLAWEDPNFSHSCKTSLASDQR